uniref:Endosome-associated-trafficking regulator 1 n=1 Tax=Leptobrachium leishanense TaxID=445787 RepID=A0A8C5PFM0_9ANUR
MSGSCKPPHAKAKGLLVEDDVEADEMNPFSFKEFVKSKSRSVLSSSEHDGRCPKDHKPPRTTHSVPHDGLVVSLDYEEPFFKDPTIDHLEEDAEEEEDDDWSAAYHPLAVERTHGARGCPLPHVAYEESYDLSTSDLSGCEQFKTWDFAGQDSPSSSGYRSKADPQANSHNDSTDDLRLHTLQIGYEKVLEENGQLRRNLSELADINKAQAEKVKDLERKLEERILEEQKEAQDLESMVQQVEQNLQMMTKRAAKAESNVTRLKQEVALLQVQLGTYKAENEALRRGETAGMNAVKQNANLALENLHKAVSGARGSIK